MAKARKRLSKILLFPKDTATESARRKLPTFDAHDLFSLINEAKTNDQADLDTAFFLALRRRADSQMIELLKSLGVDPSTPDAWRKGFFRLALLHHGVGHLAWHARRTNRNSATWTPRHDITLLRELFLARQKGLSERAAVRKLVSDPKKRQQFPYRKQGHFSTADQLKKREAALWAHLQKLKASTRGRSILDLALGVSREDLSSVERSLYELDMAGSLPKNR
jgi:hypothetical protein